MLIGVVNNVEICDTILQYFDDINFRLFHKAVENLVKQLTVNISPFQRMEHFHRRANHTVIQYKGDGNILEFEVAKKTVVLSLLDGDIDGSGSRLVLQEITDAYGLVIG